MTPAERLKHLLVKTVTVELNYAECFGIVALVSQHLNAMGWEHLMDSVDAPAEGILQKKWQSLYWTAVHGYSVITNKGHKASDLDEWAGEKVHASN